MCPGSDVVDWLHRNVEGFTDRREARKYAGNLLKAGYIRHTVNKVTFSEQCYYVFGDLCGGEDSHTQSLIYSEYKSESNQQVLYIRTTEQHTVLNIQVSDNQLFTQIRPERCNTTDGKKMVTNHPKTHHIKRLV